MIIRSFAFFASVLHASGASSPFSTPVKTVSIIGGTHGNEYTGIWCIKAIEKQRELFNEKSEAKHSPDTKVINVFKEYPTLSIDTLLATICEPSQLGNWGCLQELATVSFRVVLSHRQLEPTGSMARHRGILLEGDLAQ